MGPYTKLKMILVVDGRPFEGKLTGVGYYILSLLDQLRVQLPAIEIKIISRRPISIKFQENVEVVVEPNRFLRRLKPVVWQRFFSGRLIGECDWYWGTAIFLPIRLSDKVKTLITVHDFNHVVVPETMAWGNRLAHKAWMRKDIDRANFIMVNGKGTEFRLKKWSGRHSDIIINPPVRKTISRVEEPLLSQTLGRVGVPKPFFLAVGTHEPRKNLKLLVNVFLALKKQGKIPEFSLILAGQGGWKSKKLSILIEKSFDSGVRSLGYVSDEVLSALYSGCHAFVFPSIYEGFGMPAREARVCGAQIIASKIPEIEEAADNVGFFINPDTASLAQAMLNTEKAPPSDHLPYIETELTTRLAQLINNDNLTSL